MARNWIAQIADHPGATLEEIQNEPNWTAGRNHRVGYKNSENRVPGYNRDPDPFLEELHDKEVAAEADEQLERLRNKANHEKLINFRDIVQGIKDFHLVHPALRPTGWRYMLECTEDWVKYKQRWPCNLRREEKRQEEQEKEKEKEKEQSQQDGQTDKGESKAKEGKEKEDEKETKEDETNEGNEQSEENDQDKKKSLFARELRQELQHMNSLEDNDGLSPSPQAEPRLDTTIDEADQFSPDNWFPRSENLVRATGSFPMNAEPGLPQLFQSGLITPNHLHYVRNHGAVPRLHWEFHEVGVADGKNERVFNMEDLTTQFPAINIPVFIACDGNRRKELSKIRSAQGAPFGPAAGGCAYWKGPMLRDVLLAAGVQDPHSSGANKKKAAGWVNFEGADELPEGKYATSIPLDYAMDPRNDVILAFQMNDKPLPPDHGYPIRVVIPGYVGGRCVKWLRRIWTSEKENDSYYHIWDNRVLPSFIESTGDELAEALYHQASSRCDAQSLNSVIASPEPGEKISLSSDVGGTYRVQGFAYNGSGRMIHRVEVSLDNGASWRYCFRRFPDRPVRHSNKYWTWIHWYLDVPVLDLANGKEIAVRCFDTSNTAQPEHPSWNVLGMMNNGWYRVRFEVCQNEKGNNRPVLLCQHPVEPGMLKGGWMKPSFENQLEQQKVEALGSGSQKKLTREEIEKHDKDGDCWIVVDGRVYDATSVLSWHPGGSGIILTHAGRVHPKTSTEFNSVHDSYARKQLQECIVGSVTDKVANLLDQMKEEEEQERESSADQEQALQEHRWTGVKLIKRAEVSPDTRSYTFALPEGKKFLGLGNGQHIEVGFHMLDKMLIRPYTPTKPLLPAESEKKGHFKASDSKLRDGQGTFELTVKTYFPDQKQPGGAMSNILDTIAIGQEIDIRGPKGEIICKGCGIFDIEGKERRVSRVSFVMGGTGITPCYSIIQRIMSEEDCKTEVRVLDANNTEADILLREEMESLQKSSNGRMKIAYVLAQPPDDWKGLKGFVTKDMMEEYLFPPADGSIALVCGPPPMIKKAVIPGLTDLGFSEEENIFGF